MKHPGNNKKNVKKNTWLRKLKAFDLRLDRRQRERRSDPVDDETVRVCANCGKEFNGRFCPQCGQDASWNTFSWKQEYRNVLDFLGLCKDTLSKGIKKTFKQKPAKVKPIKKNTLKRKLKALDLRLDRRQREGHAQPVADETVRTCTNCGEKYTGRYCPQCGQAGAWDRFSWRRVIINFLDIWGLGNRPMFRTIQELFWRPGYMVRDYLYGHRQLYFPPFKLLAVTIALTLFVNFLTGEQFDSDLADILQSVHLEKMDLSPGLASIAQGLVDFGQFLADHPLYEVLFLVLFMVCCVRVAFRRVGDYNFVETFIFMIFVICQLNICNLFASPIKSLYGLVENQLLVGNVSSSSPFMRGLGGLVSVVASFISSAFAVFTTFLYVFDFRQFFGLSWKETIKRLLFVVVVAFAILSLLVIIAVKSFEHSLEFGICLAFMALLFIGTLFLASNYLYKNKPKVNKFIYRLSKLASYLLLVAMPFISATCSYNICGYHNVWILSSVALVCCVLAAAIAILPSYLYKKYHRT